MSQRAHRTYKTTIGSIGRILRHEESEFLQGTSTAHDCNVSAPVKTQAIRDKREQIHDKDLDTILRAAMTTDHVTECSRDALLRGRP